MNNLFEKLNVKREIEEEDDSQGEFQKVKGNDKKIYQQVENVEVNDEEGFEKVGNKAKKRPVNDNKDEEQNKI